MFISISKNLIVDQFHIKALEYTPWCMILYFGIFWKILIVKVFVCYLRLHVLSTELIWLKFGTKIAYVLDETLKEIPQIKTQMIRTRAPRVPYYRRSKAIRIILFIPFFHIYYFGTESLKHDFCKICKNLNLLCYIPA